MQAVEVEVRRGDGRLQLGEERRVVEADVVAELRLERLHLALRRHHLEHHERLPELAPRHVPVVVSAQTHRHVVYTATGVCTPLGATLLMMREHNIHMLLEEQLLVAVSAT